MSEPVSFQVAPEEVQVRVRDLIAEHYAATYEGQPVVAVFRCAARNDKGQSLDWEQGGTRILGQWVKVPPRFKCLMEEPPFAVLVLNAEAWDDELTEDQQTALLDHELYHGVQRVHDIGEFAAIVQRHGDWHGQLAEALPAQADLPLADPASGQALEHNPLEGEVRRAADRLGRDPGFRGAVRSMCPQEGDGLESVTISTPGHEPVVLTGRTRKKLERLAREA